MMDSWK